MSQDTMDAERDGARAAMRRLRGRVRKQIREQVAEVEGISIESVAAHRYLDGYIAALWWAIERIDGMRKP